LTHRPCPGARRAREGAAGTRPRLLRPHRRRLARPV